MLFHDDVMADRKAEPRPLTGWLGGEEWIDIFSFMSAGMPVLLSRISIYRSPRLLVAAISVGSNPLLSPCALRLVAA